MAAGQRGWVIPRGPVADRFPERPTLFFGQTNIGREFALVAVLIPEEAGGVLPGDVGDNAGVGQYGHGRVSVRRAGRPARGARDACRVGGGRDGHVGVRVFAGPEEAGEPVRVATGARAE